VKLYNKKSDIFFKNVVAKELTLIFSLIAFNLFIYAPFKAMKEREEQRETLVI